MHFIHASQLKLSYFAETDLQLDKVLQAKVGNLRRKPFLLTKTKTKRLGRGRLRTKLKVLEAEVTDLITLKEAVLASLWRSVPSVQFAPCQVLPATFAWTLSHIWSSFAVILLRKKV